MKYKCQQCFQVVEESLKPHLCRHGKVCELAALTANVIATDHPKCLDCYIAYLEYWREHRSSHDGFR
jgi:hypothetical protein